MVDRLVERWRAIVQIENAYANELREFLVRWNKMLTVDVEFVEVPTFAVQRLRENQRVGQCVRLNLEVGFGEIEQPFVGNNACTIDQIDEGDEASCAFTFSDFH